jgi:hypothetical protein
MMTTASLNRVQETTDIQETTGLQETTGQPARQRGTAALLGRLRAARASYAARRAMWRQLSSASDGMIADIEAALNRPEYDDETREVRRFLTARRRLSGSALTLSSRHW